MTSFCVRLSHDRSVQGFNKGSRAHAVGYQMRQMRIFFHSGRDFPIWRIWLGLVLCIQLNLLSTCLILQTAISFDTLNSISKKIQISLLIVIPCQTVPVACINQSLLCVNSSTRLIGRLEHLLRIWLLLLKFGSFFCHLVNVLAQTFFQPG